MSTPLGVTTVGLVHIYRSEDSDVAALAGVDLSVPAGGMVGLLGPSGSGKSTLLGLLGAVLRASAGKVYVGQRELSAMTGSERDHYQAVDCALMLQGARRNLIPYLTIRENVEFSRARSVALGALPPAVDDVLQLAGATPFADRSLTVLSQAQVQAGAFAVALAPGPGLVLADEPTSALNAQARDAILGSLLRVNGDLGTTIVLVTHDLEVARRLPRTVTIRDGRIGGEGRLGQEYAVVTVDGFLPLPVHVREQLPPGTLVHLERHGEDWWVHPVTGAAPGGGGHDIQ